MIKKNNLDEMQEGKLLHIERNGCWFTFWALIVSIFIQMMISRENLVERLAGEWIIFMCLAIYMAVACIKNGIWDRRLKANPKTNLAMSLLAAFVAGILNAIINYLEYRVIEAAFWCFVIFFILVAVACFLLMTVCTGIYKKRLYKMEEQYEE